MATASTAATQPGEALVAGVTQPLRDDVTTAERSSLQSFARTSLNAAAAFWFAVAVAGQWVFAYYVVALYGGAVVRGNLAAWNKVLPHGYVPGDSVGNTAVGLHVFFAAIIMTGGAIQLVPHVRRHAPAFHRWNGRVYILLAVVSSLVGLTMSWFLGKGTGRLVGRLATSLDAVLIIVFAALALRHALARRFAAHRRWALRLFMVVSAVWFLRIGFMFWLVANGRPVGFDPKTFNGPFITFISFACYLLPLAVLELYLRAQERAGAPARIAMASGLTAFTVAMGVGIFGATMGLWLPHARAEHGKVAASPPDGASGSLPRRMEAEHFKAMSGVTVKSNVDFGGAGARVADIHDGDWIASAPVSLRNVRRLGYRTASAGAGGTIEVRVDSAIGPLISTATIPVTGSWYRFTSVGADVTNPGGTHTLYFVFRGQTTGTTGLFNLDWVDFEAPMADAPMRR